MKTILGVVAFFGWFSSHCHDIYHPDQHGEDAGTRDAGAADDAGQDASDYDAEVDAEVDAGLDAAAPKKCGGELDLYVDEHCVELADSIRPYEPLYPLWSDGADKERFIFLPAGAKIDASNPDRWNFPPETRLYKTFAIAGRKIETRVMRKVLAAPGVASWRFQVYKWLDSQDDTELVVDSETGLGPEATKDVFEGHDIPGSKDCVSCHTMRGFSADKQSLFDAVNGFGAIQLNTSFEGVNLKVLLTEGLLSNATPDLETKAIIPGDDQASHVTRAALGYLHGNCGTCHGPVLPKDLQMLPDQKGPAAGLSLIAKVDTALKDQPVYKTGVCRCLTSWKGHPVDPKAALDSAGPKYERRIYAGHPERSAIVGRMSRRNVGITPPTPDIPAPLGWKDQMPPSGTEVIDDAAIETISAWIHGMSGRECSPNNPTSDYEATCPPQ